MTMNCRQFQLEGMTLQAWNNSRQESHVTSCTPTPPATRHRVVPSGPVTTEPWPTPTILAVPPSVEREGANVLTASEVQARVDGWPLLELVVVIASARQVDGPREFESDAKHYDNYTQMHVAPHSCTD